MRIKSADTIGIVLIAIGIMMTVLLYIAAHHPVDIESIAVQEIPSQQPTPHNNGI